jgi:hypothetical protein
MTHGVEILSNGTALSLQKKRKGHSSRPDDHDQLQKKNSQVVVGLQQ